MPLVEAGPGSLDDVRENEFSVQICNDGSKECGTKAEPE